jgi:hypothetical protein
MNQQHRLRNFAARLALLALLALHLHVLMHVFGIDRDGDDGKPCQICQLVLHQQALEAVATVLPPKAPVWECGEAEARPSGIFCDVLIHRDSRGPPAPLQV